MVPVRHQFFHQRVVARHAQKPPIAQKIGAAIAHVREVGFPFAHPHGGEGGAHAPLVRVARGGVVNRHVGALQSVAQGVLRQAARGAHAPGK